MSISLSFLIDLACLHQRKEALVSICTFLTFQFFCNIEAKGQIFPFRHSGADHREKKFTAHRKFGDRREGVMSARTYLYADEVKCDQHMETFLKCIKASGNIPSIKAD